MKALPSWKNIPATAGRSARPSGKECQWDGSSWMFGPPPTLGSSRSSVESRRDLLASDRFSEKIELRLLFDGMGTLAGVVVRFRGRCRSWLGGGLDRPLVGFGEENETVGLCSVAIIIYSLQHRNPNRSDLLTRRQPQTQKRRGPLINYACTRPS